MPERWEWDESPFTGAAVHYERGRLPYPVSLGDVAASALGLDGSGRLLDVGCGPGIVARRLAGHVASVVGIDADEQMVEHAVRRATELGVANTSWVAMRAEALPAGLGRFRIATFGQSFHWLDPASVATTVATMLEPGGALVLVKHWSMFGDPAPGSRLPAPPHDAIARLVERHVDPTRGFGHGVADAPPGTAGSSNGSATRCWRSGARVTTRSRRPDRSTGDPGAIHETAPVTNDRAPTARRAARVLVLDERDHVLLLRGIDPTRPDRGAWWFTPGGGIDPGESVADAACRELAEETGLRVDDPGAARFARDAEFEFEDVTYHQHEDFFVVHTARFEPIRDGWTEVELRSVLGHRWWSADDLVDTSEVVYPEQLVEWLGALGVRSR